MELLDQFFDELKEAIVPLIREIKERGKKIENAFLTGDYPEEKQRELAEFLAEYVGFDFNKGVLAVSAHPFTTNLHNHDVRITTHYSNHVDSSLFSVIHEAGHGIYELGIGDDLTQTLVGQGASMGMHESQSRYFLRLLCLWARLTWYLISVISAGKGLPSAHRDEASICLTKFGIRAVISYR